MTSAQVTKLDVTLPNAISSEESRAKGAEGTLQTNINNEATTRKNADDALQTDINTKTKVVNSNPTLSWSTTSTVGTVGGNALQVTMPANPVKTGFTTSGRNYKVQTDASGNLYVNVPWTDSDTITTSSDVAGWGFIKNINFGGTTYSPSGGTVTIENGVEMLHEVLVPRVNTTPAITSSNFEGYEKDLYDGKK